LNIQAVVAGPVQSVRFAYNGNAIFQTENSAPYAFCGNAGPSYITCTVLGVGNHTVTATPYSLTNAGGTAGPARTVRFSIVAGTAPTGPVAPVPVPAPVPVVAPVPAPVPVVAPVPAPVPVVVPTSGPRTCTIPQVRTYSNLMQQGPRPHLCILWFISQCPPADWYLARLRSVSAPDC
jgi:hypothetical protein